MQRMILLPMQIHTGRCWGSRSSSGRSSSFLMLLLRLMSHHWSSPRASKDVRRGLAVEGSAPLQHQRRGNGRGNGRLLGGGAEKWWWQVGLLLSQCYRFLLCFHAVGELVMCWFKVSTPVYLYIYLLIFMQLGFIALLF